MLPLTRIFEATLSFSDPLSYGAQPERSILQQLRQDYVGRCWQGYYIREVLDVIARSACRIDRVGNGGATVDVRFRVTCFQARPGDVVLARVTLLAAGQRVMAEADFEIGDRSDAGRTQSRLQAASGDRSGAGRTQSPPIIVVLSGDLATVLAPGQKAPVRISGAMHAPTRANVPAIGGVYLPPQDEPVYVLTSTLTQAEAESLFDLVHAARSLFEGLDVDAALRLYGLPKGSSLYDLIETEPGKLAEGTAWARRGDTLVAQTGPAVSEKRPNVRCPALEAATAMLTAAYRDRRAVAMVAGQYTEAERKAHQKLWDALARKSAS